MQNKPILLTKDRKRGSKIKNKKFGITNKVINVYTKYLLSFSLNNIL